MLKFVLVVIVVALVVYVVVGALGRRRARPAPPPEVAPEDREDFLWQVRSRAQQQRRRDEPAQDTSAPAPAPAVTIDPAVFAHDDVQGSSNETFTVIGGDAAAVAGALERAAARFMRVDETGTEHPDDATAQACLEQGRYTPNYVSDPEPTARGPQVHVDCKGVIPAEMARTFHRILREELQHVGAPVRVSVAHA